MKKITKTLLVALLGSMAISGCGSKDNSSSSAPASQSSSQHVSSSEKSLAEQVIAKVVVTKHNQEVSEDFKVPGNVLLGDSSYDVSWTSSDEAHVSIGATTTTNGIKQVNLVVTQPVKGEEAALVELTASVTVEGETQSKTFRVTVVPSESSANVWGTMTGMAVTSYENWVAAADSTTVCVEGVVTGYGYASSYSSYNVFFEDNDGGYYLYGIKMTSAEIEKFCAVGNKIRVEGKKTTYNGLLELSTTGIYGVELISTGNELPNADLNEHAKNNTLASRQSTYGTVLGTFKKVDNKNWIQVGAYKYEIYQGEKYNVNYAAVKEVVDTLTDGQNVKISGIVGMYSEAQMYPYAVELFNGEIEVSAEDKVAATLNDAGNVFEDNYIESAEVALVTSSYDDVTLTYALNAEANSEVFALDTAANKLTITPNADVNEATLTISATCGSVSDTLEVALRASTTLPVISVAEALEICAALESGASTTTEYYVQGTLGEITNETYGNSTLVDGDASIVVYGLYSMDGTRYDKMETKPTAGQSVVLYGSLKNFNNGTYQITNAKLVKTL